MPKKGIAFGLPANEDVSMNHYELPMICQVRNYPTTTRLQDGQHTDPIARKNENVAALLSMYCESVPKNPRGPTPPLRSMSKESVKIIKICKPEDTIRPEDKTNSKADTTTHKSSHSVSNVDVNAFEARVQVIPTSL